MTSQIKRIRHWTILWRVPRTFVKDRGKAASLWDILSVNPGFITWITVRQLNRILATMHFCSWIGHLFSSSNILVNALLALPQTLQIAAKIVSLSGHFLGKVIFFRQVEEEMLNHYRTLLWSSSNQNLADKVLLWQKITSPLGSHVKLSWYTLPDTPLQWILHHSAQFEMLSTP